MGISQSKVLYCTWTLNIFSLSSSRDFAIIDMRSGVDISKKISWISYIAAVNWKRYMWGVTEKYTSRREKNELHHAKQTFITSIHKAGFGWHLIRRWQFLKVFFFARCSSNELQWRQRLEVKVLVSNSDNATRWSVSHSQTALPYTLNKKLVKVSRT